MKTNREFIDGIYEKAKCYEESNHFDNLAFLNNSPNYGNRAKIQLVACLTLVLFTGIGYSNSNFISESSIIMEIPSAVTTEYQHLGAVAGGGMDDMSRTMQSMTMEFAVDDLHFNPIEIAEVICTAKVSRIEQSVYNQETHEITTNVVFETFENIKGSINNEFELLVMGGVDEIRKVYLDYETVFKVGEEVLLFLETSHIDSNLYILTGASLGKYSMSNNYFYENEAGIRYTVNDLKTHFNLVE